MASPSRSCSSSVSLSPSPSPAPSPGPAQSSSQSQSDSSDPSSTRSQRKIRFLVEDDLALLAEIAAAEDIWSKPYTHVSWSALTRTLYVTRPRLEGLSPRAAKERAERLVKQHKAKDNWRARQSGTDEECTRKDQLLTEAAILYDEYARAKKEVATKVAEKKTADGERHELAVPMRDGAMGTLAEKRKGPQLQEDELEEDPLQDAGPAPPKKTPKKEKKSPMEHFVGYLQNRDKVQTELRKEELQFQKEQFNAQKDERRGMLELMSTMMGVLKPDSGKKD